jgi:hypothetical protein
VTRLNEEIERGGSDAKGPSVCFPFSCRRVSRTGEDADWVTTSPSDTS